MKPPLDDDLFVNDPVPEEDEIEPFVLPDDEDDEEEEEIP